MKDNFRVYLERAHPAFLTTIVVLVIKLITKIHIKAIVTHTGYIYWVFKKMPVC